MPSLRIAKDAAPYIEDVFFDEEVYTRYLLEKRQQPEASVDKLSLTITNEGLSRSAIASFNKSENPIIRISPTRMPKWHYEQGNVLRHETEHFIQANRRRYAFMQGAYFALLGSCSIAVGGYLGGEGYETTNNTLQELPLALSIAKDTLGAAACGAFGITGTMVTLHTIVGVFGPAELGAWWAAWKQQDALPNGTLQIALK